ncbi:hypothetical protein ASG24_12450 [Methylophilus sp. Leaf414]|nr:hypothetical protein ASG24_12450 [Methylophilus sp. Leaf414]
MVLTTHDTQVQLVAVNLQLLLFQIHLMQILRLWMHQKLIVLKTAKALAMLMVCLCVFLRVHLQLLLLRILINRQPQIPVQTLRAIHQVQPVQK